MSATLEVENHRKAFDQKWYFQINKFWKRTAIKFEFCQIRPLECNHGMVHPPFRVFNILSEPNHPTAGFPTRDGIHSPPRQPGRPPPKDISLAMPSTRFGLRLGLAPKSWATWLPSRSPSRCWPGTPAGLAQRRCYPLVMICGNQTSNQRITNQIFCRNVFLAES